MAAGGIAALSLAREGRGVGGIHPSTSLLMRLSITLAALASCTLTAFSPVASAQIITQWNFNSVVADATTGTGSALPSFGSGTASLIGGVSGNFAAGSPRDSAPDNSAWSLGSWPAQGTGSGTAGVQFMVSTLGITEAIQVSFDLRQTPTASERFQLQATTDGINFSNVSGGVASWGSAGNNTGTSFDSAGLFVNTASGSNQAFVQSIAYTFITDAGFENNASFGIRLVSVFEDSAYDASGATSNYGAGGLVRLDMMTVSSAPPAVPEPATSALMMGVAALTTVALRRSRTRRLHQREDG
jgi:hypothetical protein